MLFQRGFFLPSVGTIERESSVIQSNRVNAIKIIVPNKIVEKQHILISLKSKALSVEGVFVTRAVTANQILCMKEQADNSN